MALNTLSALHDTVIRGAVFNRITRSDVLSAEDAVRVIAPLNKTDLIIFAKSNGITDGEYDTLYEIRNTLRNDWVRANTAVSAAPVAAAPVSTPVDLSGIESSIADLNRRLDSVAASVPVTPRIDADRAVAEAVEKAFKPFRDIVDSVAGAPEALAAATAVRIIDRRPAVDVFGIDIRDAAGEPVLVNIFNHPESPAIDDSYIWPEEALRYALLAQQQSVADTPALPANIWLSGDRGTGKTQFAAQFAARTGAQLVRINFDRHLERLDFIGCKGLVNGETVWQDGTFLKAFKQTGTVILLDEFGFANPANVANLQALLEINATVTYDGFNHSRANGVVVFAADNSTGNRDDSGRFRGVQEQNSALLDRFFGTVQFTFLNPAVEARLLQKRTGCTPALAKSIVKVLNVARQQTQTGEIIDAPSLRQAFALATAITAGVPAESAWNATIANKSPSESRAALDAIRTTHFAV